MNILNKLLTYLKELNKMSIEWFSEQVLKSHLKKYVTEAKNEDEKKKWQNIYLKKTGHHIEENTYEKQLGIYEDESYSLYEDNQEKDIFLYRDSDSHKFSINLIRDDLLVVGEENYKIKTCFF